MSEQQDEIDQLKARVKELEISMQALSDSARNVIGYWRWKYESK